MGDQWHRKYKEAASRQNEFKLHRIGFDIQEVTLAANDEFLFEKFVVGYADENQTPLSEDLVRMLFVLFCQQLQIKLPPEYNRRMSKEWFDDFVARHHFLYTGMINLGNRNLVFSNYFQIDSIAMHPEHDPKNLYEQLLQKAAQQQPDKTREELDPLFVLKRNITPQNLATLSQQPSQKKPLIEPKQFPKNYILDYIPGKDGGKEIILRKVTPKDKGIFHSN